MPLVREEALLWVARVALALALAIQLFAHVYLVTTLPISRWFPLLVQPVKLFVGAVK